MHKSIAISWKKWKIATHTKDLNTIGEPETLDLPVNETENVSVKTMFRN
jgi:hypothetical protein